MERLGADALVDRLQAAWLRTDALFALLAPEALSAQPIRVRQPFLFYLGHLPAFAWNQIGAGLAGRPPFDARLDALFARGIDPVGVDAYVPAEPERWPTTEAVTAYREGVRSALRALAGASRLEAADARRVLHTVVEHELMHQETLLYMAQELPVAQKTRPRGLEYRFGGAAPPARVRIAAGVAVLGADRDALAFGWDNEFPRHEVPIASFTIDTTPVRVSQFLTFVEDGGYLKARYWDDGDWAWRERMAVFHPRAWQARDGRWFERTLFDELPLEQVMDWPVSVSLAEAQAYARWRGARLPTEAELHRAAYATPDGGLRAFPWGDTAPEAGHGNYGFRALAPTPVGSHPSGASAWGVHELVGNGWEWTTTPFAPFSGFEAMSHYPGYSADFFDGRHFVLMGASWATDTALLRRSLRNWFQPQYPYVFSKFRCVND